MPWGKSHLPNFRLDCSWKECLFRQWLLHSDYWEELASFTDLPWRFLSSFSHRYSPENVTDLSRASIRPGHLPDSWSHAYHSITCFEQMNQQLTLLLPWLVIDIWRWTNKTDISQATKEYLETLNNKYMTSWKEKWVTDGTKIYDFCQIQEGKNSVLIWIVEGQFKLFEVWILKRENCMFLKWLLFM